VVRGQMRLRDGALFRPFFLADAHGLYNALHAPASLRFFLNYKHTRILCQ
jgi:hypothetical protein